MGPRWLAIGLENSIGSYSTASITKGNNAYTHAGSASTPGTHMHALRSSTVHVEKQVTIDIITHVYVQIVHKDYYMQEEDDRTLAFLERRATLDGTVQKHVELAANAAAPHTSIGDPAH